MLFVIRTDTPDIIVNLHPDAINSAGKEVRRKENQTQKPLPPYSTKKGVAR